MKSIKIKLNNLNQGKKDKLKSIINDLELISKDYLELRLKEIQAKEYKPFKEHYQNYRNQYPDLNSGILQYECKCGLTTANGFTVNQPHGALTRSSRL